MEQVEGVEEARFSYPEGTGRVRYDPERTAPEAFLEHLTRMTGFEGRVVDHE
ncbi:MAG: heavy metal-associated domain-containing protein [Longimicrobiales bacterium]